LKVLEIQVSDDLEERLDVFLSKRLGISRSQAKNMIQEGLVQLNARPGKASARLKRGDKLQVSLVEAAPPRLVPQPMDLDIVYEDEEILVLSKPAGLVVQPGAGHFSATLVHGLLAHCPKIGGVGGEARAGLVHRLDKDTSGVMVVAKTQMAHDALSRQFSQRRVHKEYLALVHGRMSQRSGTVETPLGRDRKDPKRISTRPRKPKEAVSRWELLAWLGTTSWLKVIPETGRTHQIRVHMASIGHPVVGDPLYGGKRRLKDLSPDPQKNLLMRVKRQLLHAWRISIEHPSSGERLWFQVPIPGDMEMVLRDLGLDPAPWLERNMGVGRGRGMGPSHEALG
jgi:23S rRNA pseudouridine1911/1915/1917 synthase